jgi:TPR repeat protein
MREDKKTLPLQSAVPGGTIMKSPFSLRLFLTATVMICVLSGCAAVDQIKAGMDEYSAESAYTERDYQRAADSYRKAAENGSGYGMYMLGSMYADGQGVSRDKKEAVRWMERAAEKGYPAANFTMGLWRINGEQGLKTNRQQAITDFKRAADGEDSVAMFFLGTLYARGIGVNVDMDEALRWFKTAKANGFPVDDRLLSKSSMQIYLKKPRTRAPESHQQAVDYKRMEVIRPAPENTKKDVMDPKQLTRGIQQSLTKLGYNPGPLDGILGSKTRTAIQAFQIKKGMNADGLASEELLAELKKQLL